MANKASDQPIASDALANRLRLASSYPVDGKPQQYGVRNVPAGFGFMFGAGALSGFSASVPAQSKSSPWTA
ncbi:MAG: hypothetical protein WDM87_06990 [Terracidiphilus sp.]